MVDFATAIGSSWGIAGVVLLVVAALAFLIAWRVRGPDPYVVSAGCIAAVAAVFCLLCAFGYIDIDIAWVANPGETAPVLPEVPEEPLDTP